MTKRKKKQKKKNCLIDIAQQGKITTLPPLPTLSNQQHIPHLPLPPPPLKLPTTPTGAPCPAPPPPIANSGAGNAAGATWSFPDWPTRSITTDIRFATALEHFQTATTPCCRVIRLLDSEDTLQNSVIWTRKPESPDEKCEKRSEILWRRARGSVGDPVAARLKAIDRLRNLRFRSTRFPVEFGPSFFTRPWTNCGEILLEQRELGGAN